MTTNSSQRKAEEVEFWDKVGRKRLYAAFDRQEYIDVIDSTVGVDLDGMFVVDIGCAAGLTSALFAARGATVHGVDISPELIARAAESWPEFKSRLTFGVGDAEALGFDDNTVDACFFGGVLHHFPDLQKTLEEALRVLRPGGRLIAVEPNRLDLLERIEWAVADLRGLLSPNEYPIDPRVMRQELKEAGFSQVRFWTIRRDIPVLAQIPLLGRAFNRQKGFWLKRPLLRFVDAWRAPEARGTFFVIEAIKA
ncbi:class I SAM-dependent methyltransferase [Roseospirillum parvum]|uniref:Methyltransferase domain-containing protein n=1 Tax=Roseospirillum parvum TaxID=83401 RepID=A0A1G8A2W6_9PROT|nr:class I SAM-dependent methyltransferase [Roseospirillum parvum]SDH15258.1 Methyltransferase domain-containing protein [Roseospirillum parvum]